METLVTLIFGTLIVAAILLELQYEKEENLLESIVVPMCSLAVFFMKALTSK